MFYIVLIDMEGNEHQAIPCEQNTDENQYSQMIGYALAGKFEAPSEQDAIAQALQTNPLDWGAQA